MNYMKTPLYSLKEYPTVYDPAEDSFLLLDALESNQSELNSICPLITLEIGSGSGIISTFISALLSFKPIMFCTDINPQACQCTLSTAQLNQISNINVICGNDLGFLSFNFYKKIDLIVFNPPYVVTSPLEIGDHSRAWAGGIDGRQVLDRMIPDIVKLLSAKGHFYLVTIKENKNSEIQEMMAEFGLKSKIILSRKAGIEGLRVTCFYY